MNLKRATVFLVAAAAALGLGAFPVVPADAVGEGNCVDRICVGVAHIDHDVQDTSAWVTDGQPGTIHLWSDHGDDRREDNVTRVVIPINQPRDPGTVFCAELFRGGDSVDKACFTLP